MKMDKLDYVFKFSTELVVAALSFIIIGANLFYSSSMATASTPFAKLLSYHSDRNPGLYARSTTTETIVAQSGNAFVPTASAAQVVLTVAEAQTAPDNTPLSNTPATLSNNVIQQENPDNIKAAIADQIKVYDTVSGDTLASISQKFGISEQTIIWANNLPNSTIKPGWNLVILPVSGVLHKVTNNDTLPDISKKYKVDVNKIIAYNGLSDENDINPGDLLIIPDGVVTPPPAPVKPVVHRITVRNNAVANVYEPAPGDSISGEHLFPRGQCTWYVAQKKVITFGGNAKNWLTNAKDSGYRTGNVPVAGAAVVTNENYRYGHVAYVESVNGDGTITISEYNFLHRLGYDERTISINSSVIRGYIY